MAKKETTQAVAVVASEESLAILRDEMPSDGFVEKYFPRISMASQDVMEGKGAQKKVTVEAGTFFTESPTDEKDENEKVIWAKDDIGSAINVIIMFKRKQLRMYDEETEKYTSSPIYDTDDEAIPLFCDKKEVARGTPKELKAKYQFTAPDGKQKSKLEDNLKLYVLYEGETYELTLRGSSMYSFMGYQRKVLPSVNAVMTTLSSESQEKGKIAWNQMTFTKVRTLDQEEADIVIGFIKEIKEAILAKKAYYASVKSEDADEEETPARTVKDFE